MNWKLLWRKAKSKKPSKKILDITENTDEDNHNTALLLSAQLTQLRSKEMKGIIDNASANIERNQLTNSLLNVIDGLVDWNFGE